MHLSTNFVSTQIKKKNVIYVRLLLRRFSSDAFCFLLFKYTVYSSSCRPTRSRSDQFVSLVKPDSIFFSDLPGASNWPLSTERIIKGNEPEQRQWVILTATVVAATAYLPADQLTEPSLRSLILSSKFFDHPVFLFVSRETKTPTWSVCTLLLFPFHCVFIVFVHYIVHAVLCTYMPSTVVTLSPS